MKSPPLSGGNESVEVPYENDSKYGKNLKNLRNKLFLEFNLTFKSLVLLET